LQEHFGEVVNHAKKALEAAKNIAISEKELGMIKYFIFNCTWIYSFCLVCFPYGTAYLHLRYCEGLLETGKPEESFKAG